MTDEKKELQQKYLELQLMDNQINQVKKQVQILNNQLIELELVNKSLDEFKETKKGTDIFVSLSPGIYAKAELKNNEDLIVNVGSNVVVKKKIPDTKKIINDQMSEIKKLGEELISNIQELVLKASSIEKEINSIISKKK